MSFGQAVKSVFSQYATFTGRARRAEYWWFYLFSVLVSIPFQIFFFAMYVASFAAALDDTGPNGEIAPEDVEWGAFAVGLVPLVLVGLALFLPTLAVTVRRLHDTGRSGWWYLVGFVPFGSIVLLVFTVLEGDPHANQYGPDPKAGERYMGPGYGYAQPPAQPGTPSEYAHPPAQGYAQPPASGFPPPPPNQGYAPPPTARPEDRDDPFSAPEK